MVTRNELRAAALTAAECGWHVFPLRPNTKIPAIKAWEQHASSDLTAVNRIWQSAPFNIGVATGPSGLLVVDLDTATDVKPAQQWRGKAITCGQQTLDELASQEETVLPAVWTVTTRSGGRHLYYQQPPGQRIGSTVESLGPFLDTRGHGGYVVGAGSIVDGRPYEVIDDHPPVPLPSWLAALLTNPPRPASGARPDWNRILGRTNRGNVYATTALKRELAMVIAAQAGQRNHVLNKAAYNLGQLVGARLLFEQIVTDALTDAGLSIGLSPREVHDTITSGLTAGQRNPRKTTA